MEQPESPTERTTRLTKELIAACRQGEASRALTLLDQGASPHLREPDGREGADLPIHAAAEAGSIECVQILLSRKANVNAVGRHAKTPLAGAIGNHRVACARFLLERGADPRAPDFSGMTPLHYAASFGMTELIDPLFAAGAYVDEPAIAWTGNGTGRTPLMYACSEGQTACAKALLAAGANPDYKTDEGRTPLTEAARGPDTECLDLLLQKRDPTDSSAEQVTALYAAVDADKPENVRRLLPLETSPIALESASMHAVGMGNTDIVSQFLADARSDTYIGKMLETCMERDYSSKEAAEMVLDAGGYQRAAPEIAQRFLRRLLVQSGTNTDAILTRVVQENHINLNDMHGFDRVPIEVVAGDYLDPDRVALLLDLGADPHLASDQAIFQQDPKLSQMIRAFDAAKAVSRVLNPIDKGNTP